MNNMYLARSLIRRLPGKIMRVIPVPSPETVEGFGCRGTVGDKCREAGFASVLLLTDRTLRGLGFCDAVEKSLQEAGVRYCVYDDICSEPCTDYIENGRRMALENQAQCIICLGGGSVMDTGKMIAAGCRHHRVPARLLLRKFLFVRGGTLPLVTIPSTAGTGAEITVGAVIGTKSGVKSATVIVGLDIRAVFLDSELTVNAPWRITASCGIDALSHGLEGCLADVTPDETDIGKSSRCVRLVLENLLTLKEHPDDIRARDAMCLAANLGGNAINRQLAGYIHSFAHAIGGLYGLPHGAAIALSMMPVLKAQKGKCLKALSALASYCSIDGPEQFLNVLQNLIDACELGLDGSVVAERDYDRLAVNIAKDSINYSAPQTLGHRSIIRILTEISRIK